MGQQTHGRRAFFLIISNFLMKGNFVFLLVSHGYKGHFTC
jgi:hypothetical protein